MHVQATKTLELLDTHADDGRVERCKKKRRCCCAIDEWDSSEAASED